MHGTLVFNQTSQCTDRKPKQRRWLEGSNLESWWDLKEYREVCGAMSSFPITSWEMIRIKLRNVWSLCQWSRPSTYVSGLLLKTWEHQTPNRSRTKATKKRCRTTKRSLVIINLKAAVIKTVDLNQIPVQCGTTMLLSFSLLSRLWCEPRPTRQLEWRINDPYFWRINKNTVQLCICADALLLTWNKRWSLSTSSEHGRSGAGHAIGGHGLKWGFRKGRRNRSGYLKSQPTRCEWKKFSLSGIMAGDSH